MPDEAMTLGETRLDYLERLGEELTERGLVVRMSRPRGRPPTLHVVNPDASALAEQIVAESGAEGWSFWWSWSEPITPEPVAGIDKLQETADLVAQVLSIPS